MIQLHLTNTTSTYDITSLALTIRWSGDYQQAARSLDLSLLASPSDKSVPVVACPPGSGIQMLEAGRLLFDGLVVSRTMGTGNNTLSLSCFDRGLYLKRNKTMEKFSSQTPEAATRYLAEKFGFGVGTLAATSVQLTRNFLGGGDSVYDICTTWPPRPPARPTTSAFKATSCM